MTTAQELLFKQTILSKIPSECGLEGHIWTGGLMRQFIKREFEVDFTSGIYDLLKRLNLSHQKAHSDYQNADKGQQLQFLEDFKQTLLESDKEMNARLRVKTDEKNESELMDY